MGNLILIIILAECSRNAKSIGEGAKCSVFRSSLCGLTSSSLFHQGFKWSPANLRMERASGIEPPSPAWKAGIINHYTTPAFSRSFIPKVLVQPVPLVYLFFAFWLPLLIFERFL